MRKRVTASILLLLSFSAVAQESEAELEQFFRSYLESWKSEMDFEKLVDDYWNPRAVFFPEGRGVIQLGSREGIAGALEAATRSAASQTLRTKVLSFSSCRIREDVALVALEYQAELTNGLGPVGTAVYVAERRDDRWWILAVMGSDVGTLSC